MVIDEKTCSNPEDVIGCWEALPYPAYEGAVYGYTIWETLQYDNIQCEMTAYERFMYRRRVTRLEFIQRELSKVHSEIFHVADRYVERIWVRERLPYE